MGRKGPRPDIVVAELDKLRGKQTDGKINLADAAYIKRALDEGVIKILEEAGHKEIHTLTDFRIGLGLFTCALAALAQFYPGKFPDTYWLLVVCVTLYILASVVQNVVISRIGGDVFFQSHLKGDRVLCATSKMARYSEDYELGLDSRESVWSRKQKAQVNVVTNVTLYFDTEGTLLETKLGGLVTSLLRDFELQQSGGGKKKK